MRDTIAWFFRILWVCRISLLSGVAGIVLFSLVLPAQNLLDDLSFTGSVFGEIVFWFVVFAATILVWALPIHYGARLTLDDDGWILTRAQANALDPRDRYAMSVALRSRFDVLIRWMPRVLGLAPFIALAIGIYVGGETNKGTSALQEGPLTRAQETWLPLVDGVSALIYLAIVIARRRWIDWMVVAKRRERTLVRLGYLSSAITAGFFLVAYLAPIFTSVVFPRALLIPPLFGSLVLLLSQLQRLTHRTGLPLFLVIAATALSITAANVPFHALRTLPRTDGVDGRLTIGDAVERWMAANGCSDAGTCQRHPLVVAIDGGASRAAFTAATFVGAVLDRMPKDDTEAQTPGRRIFAISGVSGGAYGAAVIQAALADAQDRPDGAAVAPCRTADRTWFGYAYRPRTEHRFRWQECLQALTSGDYLSPTIIGLAFRDFIAPAQLIGDRAVLLEQSWERHYDYTVSEHPSLLEDGRICDGASEGGLCRRMAHPRTFFDKHPKSWMPLLLLNATSVRTGRRIIASDIAASAVSGETDPLFPEAFDLGELMSSPCPGVPSRPPLGTQTATKINAAASARGETIRTNKHGVCGGTVLLDGDDVRLSTAALTSARFPFVSPAGAFEMKGAPFGDRVVDGGYFENSGLTTALEIVQALEKAGLKPLLLSIANEPAESDADLIQAKLAVGPPGATRAGLPRRPSTTPLAVYPKNDYLERMFGLLTAPFETLIATRDGHASEAEGGAERRFAETDGFFRLHVDQAPDLRAVDAPDPYDIAYCTAVWERQTPPLSMAKVSMSWWLSALVQADLDAQKCSRGNQQMMNALMAALDGSAR